MANKFPDRVKMFVSGAAGTGDITLGTAISGYQTLANAGVANGDTFSYVIEDGANWEVGVGTYNSSAPSFARTTVRASSGGGTSKITASSSAVIYASILGEDISSGASALSGLSDVALTSLSTSQVLEYNGTHWVNVSLATVASTGAYSDLSGKPTIPTNGSFALASLSDVSVSLGSGVDGYSLYWNNTAGKFELKSVSGGGNTLAGLTGDVAISSPSDGQLIVYNSGTGKWTNAAPPAVGFTVGTPPTVRQFASNSANAADAAVTMGSAPVSGNLLVAIVYSDAGSEPTAASGWTKQADATSGLFWTLVLTKTAGASESTSQNPISNPSSSHWAKGIWEISNQNATNPLVFAAAVENQATQLIAQVPTLPQATSTLFLASVCPGSTIGYSISQVFGIANIDVNLSSSAGAKAAFGHCDSNNPTYGMIGSMSAAAHSYSAYALITH